MVLGHRLPRNRGPAVHCGIRPARDRTVRRAVRPNLHGRVMKIAIVGTGAMGAVYAALLQKTGHEVWAIDSWGEHVDRIARDGLRVSGASGSYVVDGIRAGYTVADAGACDLWVVATKAADVAAVAADIAPLLRPDDVVMPFQNGLGAGERVARHLADAHVVIGIAEGFGSSIPEPGAVHHN